MPRRKRWYAANPRDAAIEQVQAWRLTTIPSATRRSSAGTGNGRLPGCDARRSHLKRTYGITPRRLRPAARAASGRVRGLRAGAEAGASRCTSTTTTRRGTSVGCSASSATLRSASSTTTSAHRACPHLRGHQATSRGASAAVIVRALERYDAPACDAIIAGLPDFFGLESGIEACAQAVRSEPGYVAVEDDRWWASSRSSIRSILCRDLVDGGGARIIAARASALRWSSASRSTRRREARRLLVVMTSGDSVEYEPTRGFYVRAAFSREDVSRLVGERPASPSGPTSVASATPMSMPFFLPADDPGPSFSNLLQRMGHYPLPDPGVAVPVTHATTCVAMRFADGVVMAGDRRATSGNLISHRAMEKVVAGRPLLGRRHRRRGRPGDGDGQALPAAARALREGRGHRAQPRGQGQPAVDDGARQPAGGDAGHGRRADLRRLRPAPQTRGACSPTTSPAAATRSRTTSPPARAACTPARSSRSATATALSRDEASTSCCRALWEAADADSATGGPDPLRGIYPVVATITADGSSASTTTSSPSASRRSLERR